MTAQPAEARDQVGPYRLIRAIGAGGSARIDLARIDRAYNFQRHVVVKRPLEHLRGDPAVAASLHREAKIGGRLRHPNLVAVLDAGVHDGYDYLVLEYIHGASLRTVMQTEVSGQVRQVPLAVALGIAIDVARGLHDAHELADERGRPLGLVHRDVSPGNVLLGLDGAVKLADFGIAKETRVATLSGSMHGTVTYMAPEQCRGHAFDRRADLFSIGVILYELVTETRLFWADNDVASLHRVLSGQVVRPRKLAPSLSSTLEDIVMTAVAHDPDKRFATARQLADALEALAASEGHVVGARWLARTVELVVGSKHAPWIESTNVDPLPPRHEQSLVSVIESLGSDEVVEPPVQTFGPADDQVVEEGTLPSAPIYPPETELVVPTRRGHMLGVAIGGSIVGVALALGITLVTGRDRGVSSVPAAVVPAPAPAAVPVPTPAPAAIPAPAPATVPIPASVPVPAAVPDPTPVAGSGSDNVKKTRHRRPLVHTPALAPAPATDPAPPPTTTPTQPAEPAGSAVKPPRWRPGMLMPTDPDPAGPAK